MEKLVRLSSWCADCKLLPYQVVSELSPRLWPKPCNAGQQNDIALCNVSNIMEMGALHVSLSQYYRKQSLNFRYWESSIKLGYIYTWIYCWCLFHHHHHVPEGLGVLSCSLILKMKLISSPLPWSSRFPSSFWSIL